MSFVVNLLTFGLFRRPTRCTICKSAFKRSYYTWSIDGKKTYLCHSCDESMERRQSTSAMKRRFVPEPKQAPSPPPAYHQSPVPQTLEEATRSGQRRLRLVLLVIGLLVTIVAPHWVIWIGILLLLLCFAACIRSVSTMFGVTDGGALGLVQDLSRRILRLDLGDQSRIARGLVGYATIGSGLLVAGGLSSGYKVEREKYAARENAAAIVNAERALEANARVEAIVAEAEWAWKNNNAAFAQLRLDEASKAPNATELSPITKLRNRIANAKVESLLGEATAALKSENIESARAKVKEALVMPHTTLLGEATKLDQSIDIATNPTRVRDILTLLPDDQLRNLKGGAALPAQLITDNPYLANRIAALAKDQLRDIIADRELKRQQQLAMAKAKADADAARIAEEEQMAAAELKRKQLAMAKAKADADAARIAATGYVVGDRVYVAEIAKPTVYGTIDDKTFDEMAEVLKTRQEKWPNQINSSVAVYLIDANTTGKVVQLKPDRALIYLFEGRHKWKRLYFPMAWIHKEPVRTMPEETPEQRQARQAREKKDTELDCDGLVLIKTTLEGTTNIIGLEIKGTVVNRRKNKLAYAQIMFNVYDKSGAQVGSALANINGLEPGGRWNFTAVSLTEGSTYKFSELTGF